jgi:hypothetical protein
MLPYLLHQTNVSSGTQAHSTAAAAMFAGETFYPPDDDLINLCVRCEASVRSFIIRGFCCELERVVCVEAAAAASNGSSSSPRGDELFGCWGRSVRG